MKKKWFCIVYYQGYDRVHDTIQDLTMKSAISRLKNSLHNIKIIDSWEVF